MAMMFGEEFSTRAYAHITECLRTGGDGVSEAYGKDIWQVLAEHPAQCEVFQNAMTSNSSGSVPAIVEAYDFGGIKRIADVGGGHGLLLGSILAPAPQMQGVLFDRPEVVGSLPEERVRRPRGEGRRRGRKLLRARAGWMRRLHHEAHHP